MIQIKNWQDYDRTRSVDRKLILYGSKEVCDYFVRNNCLKPDIIINDILCPCADSYNWFNKLYEVLKVETADVIIAEIDLKKLCQVLATIKKLKCKEKSVAYFYHLFDIHTGEYCDYDEEVRVNGIVAYNGTNNFFRKGFRIECVPDFAFEYMKRAFKDTDSITKESLIKVKSNNCQITYKNGRLLRINTIDTSNPSSSILRVYLVGACVFASTFSKDQYKTQTVLQKLLDCHYPGCFYVEQISNVGGEEKVIHCLSNAVLEENSIVIANGISKPELFLQAKQICKQRNCRFIAYIIPNIISRRFLSDYEKMIMDFGNWRECEELANHLNEQKELRNTLDYLNIENYFPPQEFFDSKETILLDFTGLRFGDYGNEIIANHLFEIITNKTTYKKTFYKDINVAQSIVSTVIPNIYMYMENLKKEKTKSQNCGAVVMTCNPFTKGHQHLIEYAASKVSFLYVFIVQEDRFEYSFKERIHMVKENTKHLHNIKVLPSGEFIISNFSFGEYFSRDKLTQKESRPDASLDLLIFAAVIAPALNIKKRFVGEEPYCKITMSYNKQMKAILPRYGCDVEEIKRLYASNGIAISASRVRELIATNHIEEIIDLVPPKTFDYIMDTLPRVSVALSSLTY